MSVSDTRPEHAIGRVVDHLAPDFDGTFTREEVCAAVRTAWDELAAVSRISTYLPILTQRLARERLTAAAQADGRISKTVPEILFVCVQNAGRSQMAAAIATHLAPDRVNVRSAGSQPTGHIDHNVLEALAERGIATDQAYPKPLSEEVVRAADVVVTMGCGDTCPVLPSKHYLDWDISDPVGQPLPVVRAIRDDLEGRVAQLLDDLGLTT